jgi:hypothetical protein
MAELSGQGVWQIAAGDPGRDYSDLFIKHDLMLIGPGQWPLGGDFERDARAAGYSGSKIGMVRSFGEAVSPNDIILLRVGYRVRAIGLADDSGYSHNDTFDDVFGWHLGHCRRVVWQDHLEGELSAIQRQTGLFHGRKQIPTFTRVGDQKILDPIAGLLSRCVWRALREMPPCPPAALEPDEVGTRLFSKGLPNEWVDKTLVAIQRQRRLSTWYAESETGGARPTEHEVVAHMILPLLLALGWSEQLLAVEWHRIDLAGFARTPTTGENCLLVCEAKGLGHGLQDSFSQAERYVERLKLGRCQKILLTDGQRLYLYHRSAQGWNPKPAGYINIHAIRTDHVAPAGTNAIDTIVALTPGGAERDVGG